jgi:hypothetical protein
VEICSSEGVDSNRSRPVIALDCPPGSLVRCQLPSQQGQFIPPNSANTAVRSLVFLCGNQCSGSGINIPGSRIRIFPSQIHGQKVEKFRIRDKYCYRKKLFLSSRKYDPGCLSRIRIVILSPSRGPGFRGQKRQRIPDPGSGFATLVEMD